MLWGLRLFLPEITQRVLLNSGKQPAEVKGRIDIEVELPVLTILVVQGPLIQFRAVTQLSQWSVLGLIRQVQFALHLKQVDLPPFDAIVQLPGQQRIRCCFGTETIEKFDRLAL